MEASEILLLQNVTEKKWWFKAEVLEKKMKRWVESVFKLYILIFYIVIVVINIVKAFIKSATI